MSKNRCPPRARIQYQIEDVNDDEKLGPDWMTYYEALRWCADLDGRLRRERVERVADARGYGAPWVEANTGKHMDDVRRDAARWHQEQRAFFDRR